MSKDNGISAASGLNNNYAIRTYNLQANVPQALPSGRKFILVSATVDITALSLSLGAENANFDNLILGISVGIREGSIKARLVSTAAQTVVMAIVTGHADIIDSRFAPSGATLPVSEADGANIALGARADAAATTDAGTFSLIALIKRLLGKTGSAAPFGAKASGSTVPGSASVTNTIVTSGSNVNGILVNSLSLMCGADPVASCEATSSLGIMLRAIDSQNVMFASPVTIPAGADFQISTRGDCRYSAVYTVL